MSTIGARCVRKSVNEKPAAVPIRMFGGSPTSVATPPMLDSITSPMRNGIIETPRMSAIDRVTGIIRMIVVTLSRIIEISVVANPSDRNTSQGRPFVVRAAAIATYSKKPVSLNKATSTIIPNRRTTVL